MLKRNGEFTIGTHIVIRNLGKIGKDAKPDPKKKTNLYGVWSSYDTNHENPLGRIEWFSRWRKYCFFPAPNCVFEETCMRELSQFIEEETKAQIKDAKLRNAVGKKSKEAKRLAVITYIKVLCGACGHDWVQEDGDYVGPRPCQKCGSPNTEEMDVDVVPKMPKEEMVAHLNEYREEFIACYGRGPEEYMDEYWHKYPNGQIYECVCADLGLDPRR